MAQPMSQWSRVILFGCLLCVGTFQVSGAQQSVKSTAFSFYMEITNRPFEDSLLDPSSDYYKSLESEVEDLMDKVFKCSSCGTSYTYAGATDMTFKGGSSSVIVKTKLLFNTLIINSLVVEFLFIDKIIADPPKALKVNLEYTKENEPMPVPATV
ncbi:mucin-1 [Clupea harengus]|uniref:Mucin-1 n=1 Tax=Clupea harengus TaxID=7950 RepID=A0A6P8GTT1_CLUHA|nr:mucin-1 [Clupea harengus]